MADAAATPDDELLAGLRAGNEEAFVELVARYRRPLLRLARHFVKDDAQAEDVVQDTWVGVLRGLERFEGRATFRTWLFRVLVNRAKTRGVKESRYVPLEVEGEAPEDANFDDTGRWREPPAMWTITPERLTLSDEVRKHLAAALEELPPAQRAVVELREIEGLDSAEVCNILGVTETNQRVLLHRGRTRLRAALSAVLR